MEPERISIYVKELSDLSERQIQFAFVRALRECKFIPQISELRVFAAESAIQFQRADAAKHTQKLLARDDKPPEWNPRLDEAWDEVERFMSGQEREDLAHIEVITNEQAQQKPFPGPGRWVDWARRKEARDRSAAGIQRPHAQALYEAAFQRIATSPREPGDEV